MKDLAFSPPGSKLFYAQLNRGVLLGPSAGGWMGRKVGMVVGR